MAINRFDQYVPLRSNYIPQNFVPNFEAYKGILEQEQQNYNNLTALQDIPIDALAGADEQYAQQLRSDLSRNIDSITDTYRTNFDEGRRRSRDFIRDTRRRVLPGGDIRELANRKQAFTTFQSEQQKRLQNNEITREQYWASVQRAKQQYDTQGGLQGNANLNLNARSQAINFDKFANEFLKNFEADSGQSMGLRYDANTGKMYFDKTKVTQLQAAKIQRDLTSAYRNAAGQTGQLADLYNYRLDAGLVDTTDNRQLADDIVNQINTLNLDNPEDAGKAQELLNQLGSGLTVDKIAGSKTLDALDRATELANLSDNEMDQLRRAGYMDSYINSLAAPYSDAASFRRIERDAKVLGRTLQSEFDLHKRKKQLDNAEFLFTGQGMQFNLGEVAKSRRDLKETTQAQQLRIKELEARRAKVAESPNLLNQQDELKYVQSQLNWEQAKLDNLRQIEFDAYEKALSEGKYTTETKDNLRFANETFDEVHLEAKEKLKAYTDAGGSQNLEHNFANYRAQILAEKMGITSEEAAALYETREEVLEMSEDHLQEASQLSLATIELPTAISKRLQGQLNGMGFDFYDESGPIRNVNQTSIFGSEKDGTRPVISDRMRVRNISQTSYGDLGHMLTLEDTETGQVYYANARNSNISDKIGNWLLENGDGEAQEIGFMMANGRKISSQVNDIRDGQSGVVVVGDVNEVAVPIAKEQTKTGLRYEITIPIGPDAGKTMSFNNDEQLNKALFEISQDAKQEQ